MLSYRTQSRKIFYLILGTIIINIFTLSLYSMEDVSIISILPHSLHSTEGLPSHQAQTTTVPSIQLPNLHWREGTDGSCFFDPLVQALFFSPAVREQILATNPEDLTLDSSPMSTDSLLNSAHIKNIIINLQETFRNLAGTSRSLKHHDELDGNDYIKAYPLQDAMGTFYDTLRERAQTDETTQAYLTETFNIIGGTSNTDIPGVLARSWVQLGSDEAALSLLLTALIHYSSIEALFRFTTQDVEQLPWEPQVQEQTHHTLTISVATIPPEANSLDTILVNHFQTKKITRVPPKNLILVLNYESTMPVISIKDTVTLHKECTVAHDKDYTYHLKATCLSGGVEEDGSPAGHEILLAKHSTGRWYLFNNSYLGPLKGTEPHPRATVSPFEKECAHGHVGKLLTDDGQWYGVFDREYPQYPFVPTMFFLERED